MFCDNFLQLLQFLIILTIFDNFWFFGTIMDNFWQFWNSLTIWTIDSFDNSYNFYNFDNDNDNPRELWLLRHWLQFWQLRTWIHDNLCHLTIKSDTAQHSQFLRCFYTDQIFQTKFYPQEKCVNRDKSDT